MTFNSPAAASPWRPDILLGFRENRRQATILATALGASFDEVEVHTFPDRESLVRLPNPSACRGKRVALFRSLDRPNDKIIELLLAASTLSEAREIILIAPYLAYMRQDKAFREGEAISQMVIGDLLARSFHRIVTIDPHLHRQPSLEAVFPHRPCLCLTAADVIADFIRNTLPENAFVLGPDEESTIMAGKIANAAGREWSVARKIRRGDHAVDITLPETRSFQNRMVVIVDDVISSGHTIAVLARQLRAAGAAEVVACVTHALHDAGATKLMAEAGVDRVASSDTVEHESNRFSVLETIAWSLTGCGARAERPRQPGATRLPRDAR